MLRDQYESAARERAWNAMYDDKPVEVILFDAWVDENWPEYLTKEERELFE